MSTARSKVRWIALSTAAFAVLTLGGCADYLNHRDRVSLAAGDAMQWNQAVHTIDPWPPAASNTAIPGDGKKLAGVIGDYQTPAAAAPPQQVTVNVNN
jgi:hypothetical protein